MGLDPADVKYVIVGHGHFDHFGGAPYFQDKYKSRIAMSGLDWDLIERPNPNANPAQASRPRPKRDVVVTDGQKITVGDTTITLASRRGTPSAPRLPDSREVPGAADHSVDVVGCEHHS